MAPVTKDSVEVASFSNDAAASSGSSVEAGPRCRRPSARGCGFPGSSGEGSRFTRRGIAAQAAAPRTEPFEEQTNSMIVFPQGGVLRMSTAVSPGQMLVVTNLKDAPGRDLPRRQSAHVYEYAGLRGS